ncbi:CBS domain-containing protein [Parapedomonas caeni]|jgi:CBS domain-containing protein
MTIAAILAQKGGDVILVSEEAAVSAVVEVLHARRIGAVLAVDANDDVTGVVSERDVIRGLATHGASVLQQPARTIMSSPVITCHPRDRVQDAMALMTSRRFRHLPVVADGQLLGIVSIGDLVKRRIEDAEHEAEALKIYITS